MATHLLDYLSFMGLVIGSAIIGVYFGWFKKSETVNQYLVGDGTHIYPAIISIVVTFTTPKHLFADPAEVVMYGTQFSFGAIFGQILGGLIFTMFFLPIQENLKTRSLLEYFELRHNRLVRMVAAVLMMIKEMALLPILIYMTASVLNQLMGVSLRYSYIAIVLLTVFYTCMGGLHAVMWTDTLQYGYLLAAVTVCTCVGANQVGGVRRILQDAIAGERLEVFNYPRNLFYDRVNVVNALVNETLYGLSIGLTNQSFYQRNYCVRKRGNSRKVVILSYAGNVLSRFGGLATGLILYSYFDGCHPLLTHEICKAEQSTAYFISKVSQSVPGLVGLFSAGVTAAALSTMSTSLNTIACLFHDDLVLKIFSRESTTKSSFLIMKSTIVTVGIFALIVTPLLEDIESFQQAIIAFTALTGGAIMSMFLFSMTNPWISAEGLTAGAFAGAVVPCLLMFNHQRLISEKKLIYATKFISTYKCNETRFHEHFANHTEFGYHGTGTVVIRNFEDLISGLSSVSYLWYTSISICVTLIVSCFITLCTRARNVTTIKPDLICPQMRWMIHLQKSQRKSSRNSNGEKCDAALLNLV